MKPLKLLYIEDDDSQRLALEELLRSRGYEVTGASSGKAGIQAFKKNRPDIVLCDLNMPEDTGLEVLAKVKQIDPEVPVVILTAHGTVDQAVQAIKQDADDFILKPLEINKIEATIEKAIEKLQLQRELQRSEANLQMLMENVPDIVYSLNPKGEFLSVSPAGETILGYKPNEMLATSVFDYIHEEDREGVKEGFRQAMQMGDATVKVIQFRMVSASGEIKHFEVNRRLVFQDGAVVHQDGVARDITERKKLERELQKYSQELENLVDERTQSLEYATRQLAALNAVSNRFTQIYDEEALLKEAAELLIHSLDFDRASLFFEKDGELRLQSYCFAKDPPELVKSFLDRVQKKTSPAPPHFMESYKENKTIFIPDLNADPRWPREDGQIVRTKAVVISSIRVDKKPVGVIVGNMQYHERAMDKQDIARFEMFANMVGLALDNIRAYQTLEKKVIERTQSLRSANRKLRDKAKELETIAYSLGRANVELLSVQEQLETKNAEMEKLLKELSETEEKFRQLTENINEVFWMVDLKTGETIYVSPKYEEIFARPSKKLYENPNDWLEGVHPEDRPQLAASLKGHSHEQNEQKFRIVLSDQTVRWIRSRAFPVRNSNGEIFRVCGVSEDITDRQQASEALRRERNFVAAILDTAGALVVVLDPQGRIVRFNRACEETTGYSFADVEGKHFWDLFLVPMEVVRVRAVFEELRAGNFPNQNENYWLTKKGERRLIAWSNTALHDRDGKIEYIIGTGIDITERKQAEEKLKLYKEIFINSSDPINILDPEGKFIEQNPAHRKLNGYTDKELNGETPALFTGEETFRKISESLSETGRFRGEIVSHPKSGLPVDVELSAFSIYDEDGEVNYRVGFARDITERRQAEERIATRLRYEEGLAACSRALLDGREAHDALEEAIIHLVVAANVGRVYIFENHSDEEEGLSMRQTHEFCAPGVKPSLEDRSRSIPYQNGFIRWQRALSKGKPVKGITERLPEKEKCACEAKEILSILLLPISVAGNWYGFVGFDDVRKERDWGDEDIRLLQTSAEMIGGYIEHRQAEDALRESEERFRSIAQSANDAIISADSDGYILSWSKGAQTIFGYSEDEIRRKPLTTIMPKQYRDKHTRGLKRFSTTGKSRILGKVLEMRGLRKDGTEFPMELSLATWKAGGEVFYGGIVRDITERKLAEDALLESEERFRNLVENANDIIYSLTPDGKFTYVSPNWTDLLGYELSEVLERSFEPFVHPNDLEACRAFLLKVVETGQKQSGIEYRVKHKNGSWKWHATSASPLKDENGNVLSFVGIAHDITERKKFLDDLEAANRHLRDTQAQLVQSEKMASLGMLVAGIAHEINTPIGAVHSMHDTLQRAVGKLKQTLETEFPSDYQENKGLLGPLKIIDEANKVIENGSERVTNIVRRLRSFARLDEAELKTVDIHEGFEDTLTLIHHEIKHNININRNYGDFRPIACFPGRLNQVFLNLLINAKQAIKGKGEITITTFERDNQVYVEIKDSGVGIPEDKLQKIFDPGFTTKGVGVGTGLGLSIVYQIVQDHKGEIKIESEVGKGSRFTLVLPMDLDRRLETNGAS